MKNTDQLQPSTYYHIYNRGINGEVIFKKPENYAYFLRKFNLYISPVADTFAFCLLKNHFHFLIQTNSESEIDEFKLIQPKFKEKKANQVLSLQFAHFFNGYSQAINKQEKRTGKLFELPFRRVAVADNSYFTRLIYYIHANPERHRLVDDFKIYRYSSYMSHLSHKSTRLQRDKVLEWFGGVKLYKKFHQELQIDSKLSGHDFQDFDC
ncbi:MAG: hypothetical protein R8N23_07440 [Reichenbachiella sp.]|uniref:hypothetical protein n=1 Tax=Reichenbachiella sp. TaxID=2184521 RepID=UPI002967290A|nr:hypothetical protein [Reichenbachiella sp.]MDW3209682.1 hypothetical protein [Reichenbachiella sp.]